MAKEITYSDKSFVEGVNLYQKMRKKPFWVRWKCEHHLIYCGNGYNGWRKWWVCEKCRHLEVW